MPANLDVEGYEELDIRLPSTCLGTTAVQLAVAMSHLSVRLPVTCSWLLASCPCSDFGSSTCPSCLSLNLSHRKGDLLACQCMLLGGRECVSLKECCSAMA